MFRDLDRHYIIGCIIYGLIKSRDVRSRLFGKHVFHDKANCTFVSAQSEREKIEMITLFSLILIALGKNPVEYIQA